MPTDLRPERPSSTDEGRSSIGPFALAAVACGLTAAVQSRMNDALGAPVEAAGWSFASGWALLALGLLVLPRARAGLRGVIAAVREGHLQRWEILGGVFVAVQTCVVPRTGGAMFTIAQVGGQTANALLADRLGLGPAGRTPVTVGRVVAALATFAGVVVASSARGGSAGSAPVAAIALAVLASAGMAVQQAVNGKVNVRSKNPWATTRLSVSWGTLVLLAWAGVQLGTGRAQLPDAHALGALPWWSVWGAIIGCTCIAVRAVVVGRLGVLLMALLSLTGQLVGAVPIDLASPPNGPPGAPRRPPSKTPMEGCPRERNHSRRQGHSGDHQGRAQGACRGSRRARRHPGARHRPRRR